MAFCSTKGCPSLRGVAVLYSYRGGVWYYFFVKLSSDDDKKLDPAEHTPLDYLCGQMI